MPQAEDRRNMRPEDLDDSAYYASVVNILASIVQYITDDTTGAPNANAIRLGITAEQVTTLGQTIYAPLVPLYNAYILPTRGRDDIVSLRNFISTHIDYIKSFQQDVKKRQSNAGNLTGTDYQRLGIHQDEATRTPVRRLEVPPKVVSIGVEEGGNNRFAFNYPGSAALGRERMQHGQHVRCQYGYSETRELPDALPYVTDTTRTRHTIHAPENTPVGTFGWIRACYVNTRGEAGPYSDPLMFVVA